MPNIFHFKKRKIQQISTFEETGVSANPVKICCFWESANHFGNIRSLTLPTWCRFREHPVGIKNEKLEYLFAFSRWMSYRSVTLWSINVMSVRTNSQMNILDRKIIYFYIRKNVFTSPSQTCRNLFVKNFCIPKMTSH